MNSHLNPKEIENRKEYYRYKNIAELIELRDKCYEIVKEIEKREHNNWNIAAELEYEQFLPDFSYEANMRELAFICLLIEEKSKSMWHYCIYSPMREKDEELMKEMIETI